MMLRAFEFISLWRLSFMYSTVTMDHKITYLECLYMKSEGSKTLRIVLIKEHRGPTRSLRLVLCNHGKNNKAQSWCWNASCTVNLGNGDCSTSLCSLSVSEEPVCLLPFLCVCEDSPCSLPFPCSFLTCQLF